MKKQPPPLRLEIWGKIAPNNFGGCLYPRTHRRKQSERASKHLGFAQVLMPLVATNFTSAVAGGAEPGSPPTSGNTRSGARQGLPGATNANRAIGRWFTRAAPTEVKTGRYRRVDVSGWICSSPTPLVCDLRGNLFHRRKVLLFRRGLAHG